MLTPAKAIADGLRAAQTVLIVNHENPDGDCLGSSLALALALESLGKQVTVASTDGVPAMYGFLPGADRITERADLGGPFDVAVGVECSDVHRAGKFAGALSAARVVVNIDHHLDNSGYGDLVWSDPEASAVAELFYRLILELGCEVDERIATCLMTGLLTDTGSFRYASVRPDSYLLAAELVRRGAQPHRIYERVYESRPPAAVRLLGLALARMVLSGDGALAWTVVDEPMLQAAGARWEDTENIVGTLRSVAGVRLAVLFKVQAQEVKVSLRARDGVRANDVALRFGGGGHVGAAGFTARGPFDSVLAQTLQAAEEELRRAADR
ncbi:MAG: DHH family phosphoesterase [Armatimonadota bacterium]|nr:DHH family phosphoesterase [Armatimonadota bacterium]MDR5697576.1 DHH family phosphoesterase [Armatimonadota bacterium]